MHPLPPIALACADTERARLYAEKLAEMGAAEVEICCYGAPRATTPLSAVAARMGWRYMASTARGIGELSPPAGAAFALFAGLPGEIVPAATLESWPPMLHFHPGDLPAYRGSTTLYYALLRNEPITVSALILSKDIDEGPVLMKKRFPVPSTPEEVDGPLDARVRADTLGDILEFWKHNRRLPPPLKVDNARAQMYYIIHPLLKHLALLRPESGNA
jgi:methionyl-tRNA formyltransferase